MTDSIKIHSVILSGGSGTRLWPLSREHCPKQLLCLQGAQTLLQQTVGRLDGLKNVAGPLVVCNEEHRFLVTEQIRQLSKTTTDIILEPAGRNTTPALTLAALALTRDGSDPVMLIMPAYHLIQDTRAFHAAVNEGAALADAGRLVTFGILPTTPETGYGYIKCGVENTVAAFVEKPDAETAARYLASGDYLWNSGLFMMRASVWLEELGCHHPDMLKACQSAYTQGRQDGEFYRLNNEAFLRCPNDSVDYAVMEKTDRAVVVPLAAGWSDISAWPAIWQMSPQDEAGNVVQGDVYAHDTRNALLISCHRLPARGGRVGRCYRH